MFQSYIFQQKAMKLRKSNKQKTLIPKTSDGRRIAFSNLLNQNFEPADWLHQYQKRKQLKTSRKKRQEKNILADLRQEPKSIKSTVLGQFKYLMSSKPLKQKSFISRSIINQAIKKILSHQTSHEQFQKHQSRFLELSDKILMKQPDSEAILKAYESCIKLQVFPPTVHFMLIYLGVFLYSINGEYNEAQTCCRKFFDLIVRYKVEEYFMIYLMMQIRLKTNLSQWQRATHYLTKLISFSWLYGLSDLEIWCYFEFSRAFFFLEQKTKSDKFRQKSEMNYLQPKNSIYRELLISQIKNQIRQIWQGQLQFSYDQILDETRLLLPPKQKFDLSELIKDQRKLQSSIKKIISECKIRHVNQLLTRIAETNQLKAQPDPFAPKKQHGGNNFILTHRSRNKNMKIYFRSPQTKQTNNEGYYTIENSNKNWTVLREMLKNIQLQIDYTCRNS